MKAIVSNIGFSFFWQVILKMQDPNNPEGWHQAFPDIDESLKKLQESGVSSIELKATQRLNHPLFLKAVEKLLNLGFDVTFHSAGRIQYPTDYYWQIQDMIEISKMIYHDFHFKPLWIVHPLFGVGVSRNRLFQDTVVYLKELLEKTKDVPMTLALENLRNRPDNERVHAGDSYHEILRLLNEMDSCCPGVCWDFGHACAMVELGVEQELPPDEFVKRVVHCHVHDCRLQVTHLPLGMGNVPLRDFIRLLVRNGFQGKFNMEIVPYKIKHPAEFPDLLFKSTQLLQSVVLEETEQFVTH